MEQSITSGDRGGQSGVMQLGDQLMAEFFEKKWWVMVSFKVSNSYYVTQSKQPLKNKRKKIRWELNVSWSA